jgi:hypothetical protein
MKTRRTTRAAFAPKRWSTRAITTAIAVVSGGSASVLACPLCFGAQETSLVNGTKLGILVLLIILLVVQGAFAGFFLYLRQRAKRIADLDLDMEWAELQEGTSK